MDKADLTATAPDLGLPRKARLPTKRSASECFTNDERTITGLPPTKIARNVRSDFSSSVIQTYTLQTTILGPYIAEIMNTLTCASLSLQQFAGICFEKNLIDRSTKNFVISGKGHEGANMLGLVLELKVERKKSLAAVLVEAMKELELLIPLADKISQNLQNDAAEYNEHKCHTFFLNRCHNRICIALIQSDSLTEITGLMFQEMLIDQVTKIDISRMSGYEGANCLLDSLAQKCEKNIANLLKVIQILKQFQILPEAEMKDLNIGEFEMCNQLTQMDCDFSLDAIFHHCSSICGRLNDSNMVRVAEMAYSVSLIDMSTKQCVMQRKGVYGAHMLIHTLANEARKEPAALPKIVSIMKEVENAHWLMQQMEVDSTNPMQMTQLYPNDHEWEDKSLGSGDAEISTPQQDTACKKDDNKEAECEPEDSTRALIVSKLKKVWNPPSILQQFEEREASLIEHLSVSVNQYQHKETLPPEVAEMMKALEEVQTEDNVEMLQPTGIEHSLPLIHPSGPLAKTIYRKLYSSLFKMAWNGKDYEAFMFVKRLRKNESVPVDLKIICMEVIHTVNTERDLKVLMAALAYTDRFDCENKYLLKCRVHRRIAGIHYRNGDIDEAEEHVAAALQLAHWLIPDIDTVYTNRLEALLLFEQYKSTHDDGARKGAEKYFERAMDHAQRQPEWKRFVTERVKISKAHFHLDMLNHLNSRGCSTQEIQDRLFN